jgi:lipopolysaccharide transport system permease protein
MQDPSITVISPEKTSLFRMARDLAQFRDLLFLLIWREVSVRYKQTAVGILWVALQPLLAALILGAFVFGRLGNMPSDGLPYLVFAYSGILIWNCFSQGIDRASGSIVADEALIRRVYFPRWILPLACVGSTLVDFLVCTLLFLAFVIFYAIPLSWHLVFFIPALFLVVMLSASVGMATAALNAKYRDFRLLATFALQILLFISPVFYSFENLSPQVRGIVYLNPMAGPIELFRLSVTGQSHFYLPGFVTSVVVEMLVFIVCVRIFSTLEDDLVDTI